MGLFSSNQSGMDSGAGLSTPQGSNDYIPPSPQPIHPMMLANDFASKELAMLTIQNQDLVDKFENWMKGIKLNLKINEATGEEEAVPEQVFPPIMNAEGIASMVNYIEIHIHRNTIMTSMRDENQISDLMMEIHIGLTKDVLKNSKKYAFDIGNTDLLIDKMTDTILFSINRGYKREESELLYGGRKEVYQHSSDDYARYMLDKQKGGFLRGW